jgi:hypothetical protein
LPTTCENTYRQAFAIRSLFSRAPKPRCHRAALLPIDAIRGWAAVAHGLWYARSIDIVPSPLDRTLIWMRVSGDIVFGLGALMVAIFVFKLWHGSRGHVAVKERGEAPSPLAAE